MRIDGVRPTAVRPPPRLDEHGDRLRAALKRSDGWPRDDST